MEPEASVTDVVVQFFPAPHRVVMQCVYYVGAAEKDMGPSKGLEARDQNPNLPGKVGAEEMWCRRQYWPARNEYPVEPAYVEEVGAYQEVVVTGCWI